MKIGYPCPPFNAISNPFDGPPSVPGARIHGGIDLPCPNGANLLAPLTGTVTQAVWGADTGIYIEVSADGWFVRMLHLRSALVHVGQAVTQGQHIGYTNNTGKSTGPHVHMDVAASTKALALTVQPDPEPAYGRWRVDPELLLKEEDDMSIADIDKRIVDLVAGAPNIAEGGFVRAAGAGEVYILLGGEIRWLAGLDIANSYGWTGQEVEVNPVQLLAYPTGPKIDKKKGA